MIPNPPFYSHPTPNVPNLKIPNIDLQSQSLSFSDTAVTMSSFVGTQPAKLDEPESDLHNSAQKGNFEGAAAKLPELDLEGDLETQKRIFKYLSIPERYAKRRCPICAVNNDGQCCHFVQEHGTIPALKICIKCGKVGEHRSWECSNVASRSDTVINDKRPAPESEGAAAKLPE